MIRLFNNPVKKVLKTKKYLILNAVEPSITLENHFNYLLNQYFKSIYKPIAKILVDNSIIDKQKDVLNSVEDLLILIKSNKIIYDGTGFVYSKEYKANTLITKELQKLGGVFNSSQKKWYINSSALPTNIRNAITTISAVQNNLSFELANYFQEINTIKDVMFSELKTKIKESYKDIVKDTIKQSNQNFTEQDIKIDLKFNDVELDQIATNYANNLELAIKNFTTQQIADLREIVMNNVNLGLRSDTLVEQIQSKFNVSKSKAQFLASQETQLATSTIQEQNMLRSGIEYYMWDSARDSKVRPQHQELNGKIFRFDNPPIVDLKTGRRANSGGDFRCRCVARPVIVDIENLRPFYENGYTYYKFVS
jgi:SPP1 gp7 family putative phage head morphogenesis protein